MSSAPTVSVREWTDVVRRARLGRTVKGVALMLATYADYADGTRVYPGLARLAVAAEVDYKTAKRAVSALLSAGLIEPVGGKSGVHGRGAGYRLTLGENLLESMVVLSPAQFDLSVEHERQKNLRSARTGARAPRPPAGVNPEDGGVDTPSQPVDNPKDGGSRTPSLPGNVDEGRGTADPVLEEGRGISRPRDGVRRSAIPPIDLDTTTTSHSDRDLRTAVTHTRATGPPQDPNSSLPEKCAHGLTSRLRADGKPSCAICRREGAEPPANVLQLRPRTA